MLLTTVVVGACAALLLACRSFRKQLGEKESALATASTARLAAEASCGRWSVARAEGAFGEVRGIDGQNNAMYWLGVLKHAPPKFVL